MSSSDDEGTEDEEEDEEEEEEEGSDLAFFLASSSCSPSLFLFIKRSISLWSPSANSPKPLSSLTSARVISLKKHPK